MKNIINKMWIVIFILFIFVPGYGADKDKKENPVPAAGANKTQTSSAAPADIAKQAAAGDIAVSVDGKVLKKAQLEKDVKALMKVYKDKIPKDKTKEAKASIKKQLVENFIVRTVLENEIEKRKVEASENEINESVNKIKANIPANKKFADFLKENNLTMKEFNKAVAFEIKVKKIVFAELGDKANPSEKEISKFYDDNTDKFTVPENVHVRHILVLINKGDDDKVKSEKKAKIENLRQQVLGGADFAEVARKNSDCPSKEKGGDLGNITRGQTVEPFENAAFSQEKNEIGPVVTTDYGYHVIQVLDHNPKKTIALEEVNGKISDYLEKQKQADVLTALIKKLRENAKIMVSPS
ncbi:MAG: peptidylprolyl isomerase [Smithellaceae bacterium]